ncbi:MAG: Omp28-related outer membrane protein [Chlorobi bacterium]|nr:Omp28-related outer membrane protein [Chlorobiota bacterium]
MGKIAAWILALMIGWAISGCDVISPPYTKSNQRDTTTKDTGMVLYRKVLVEEFTGAQCTNCPLGHRKLADLGQVFGDSIVVVSIHAGEFARPDLRKGYTADFRTPEGEELNTRFRVFAYPAAVIDRTQFGGTSYVVGVQNWGSAIATELRTTTPVAIHASAFCDTTRGELSISVQLRSIADVLYPLNIGYYILEDSLVAPQLDNGVFIPEYVHRHVLRAAPLGAYGEPLISSTTPAGTTFERTYLYNLSSSDWNRRRLEAVVFIVRPEPNYTVVQCTKVNVAVVSK